MEPISLRMGRARIRHVKTELFAALRETVPRYATFQHMVLCRVVQGKGLRSNSNCTDLARDIVDEGDLLMSGSSSNSSG